LRQFGYGKPITINSDIIPFT